MNIHVYSKGNYGTCKWKTFLLRLKQDTALREEDWDQSKVIPAGRAEGSFMGKGGRQGREGEQRKKLVDPAVLPCVHWSFHAFFWSELLFGVFQGKIFNHVTTVKEERKKKNKPKKVKRFFFINSESLGNEYHHTGDEKADSWFASAEG